MRIGFFFSIGQELQPLTHVISRANINLYRYLLFRRQYNTFGNFLDVMVWYICYMVSYHCLATVVIYGRFARCMFCLKSVLVSGCMILFFATYMSLHENIELNCENINKLCLVGVVRYETYIKS